MLMLYASVISWDQELLYVPRDCPDLVCFVQQGLMDAGFRL